MKIKKLAILPEWMLPTLLVLKQLTDWLTGFKSEWMNFDFWTEVNKVYHYGLGPENS